MHADFIEPDVIRLDVVMPGVEGLEVCRRLMERYIKNAKLSVDVLSHNLHRAAESATLPSSSSLAATSDFLRSH